MTPADGSRSDAPRTRQTTLNIYRGISFIFSAKFGTIFLQFLIAPLLIRFLGAEYGNYAFVMAVLAFAVLFFNGAVFDGIRKFIAEHSDRTEWKSEVFGYYVRTTTLVTAAIAVLLLAAVELGLVRRLLGPGFDVYFYLLLFMVVTREFFVISRGTLMGLGAEHISESLFTLQRLIFGVSAVSLAVLGFGVVGVLVGDIVATTIVMVAGLVFVSRRIRIRQVFVRPSDSFPGRKLLGYNSQSLVLSLLFNSLYNVDILLLRPLAGAQTTAQYKAALLVAEFLWIVPIAIQNSLLYVTSEMWSRGQYDEIDSLASRITRYTVLLHVLMALGIAVLARPFVSLYFGSSFVTVVTPLLVLLPGALGYAVARPLLGIGKGKGDLRLLVYGTLGAATINLALNLLLIPRYGMLGAAVSTTTGYGSMLLFHLWSARSIGFDPLGDLRLGRIALTAGITFPVIYALAFALGNGVLSLVVVPPIGAAVYTAMAFWSGALDSSEVRQILERLPIHIPSRVINLFGA